MELQEAWKSNSYQIADCHDLITSFLHSKLELRCHFSFLAIHSLKTWSKAFWVQQSSSSGLFSLACPSRTWLRCRCRSLTTSSFDNFKERKHASELSVELTGQKTTSASYDEQANVFAREESTGEVIAQSLFQVQNDKSSNFWCSLLSINTATEVNQ